MISSEEDELSMLYQKLLQLEARDEDNEEAVDLLRVLFSKRIQLLERQIAHKHRPSNPS